MEKDYEQQWREMRRRLAQEQKALIASTDAYRRGEACDVLGLAIKRSEVRALTALSRSLMKKCLEKPAAKG